MPSFYGLMVVLGPLVLGAVLLWALLNNRRTKREEQRTEDATRKMYDQQARDDKAAK